MLQGQTLNVALNPLAAKQLRTAETFVPAHLELRNGVRTDAGFYKGRPGYDEAWDVGVDQPMTLLFPKRRGLNTLGFGVTEDGHIYELFSTLTSQLLTGPTLNGVFRPTWCEFDGTPIIADGQAVVQINPGTTVSLLGGNPPAARFCAVLADRVILSGYNDADFTWSDPGTAIVWPGAANTSSVTGHGEAIQFMQVANQDLFFFKTASIEIWSHIGGIEVFGRRAIITCVDKFSRNRGISGYSVVQGDDTFYFYADGDFWKLEGFQPIRISGAYKREIGALQDVSMLYGFHFAQEHLIRWFEPISARCFVYDYVNQVFTEDNAWVSGAYQRLPIFSYAEFDGVPYIGDYDPTGKVYRWGDDLVSDDGRDIRLLRRLRIPFPNAHQHRITRLRLRFQRGTGGSAAVTEKLLVRWALDEAEYGPYADVAVGDDGDRNPYVDVFHPSGGLSLGVGREMQLEIVQTDAVPHVFTHANLTIKPLGR